MLRILGNIALFFLIVLGTLDKYREIEECRDNRRWRWFPTLLWLALCINLLRLLFGFTYEDRKPKKKGAEVALVQSEQPTDLADKLEERDSQHKGSRLLEPI